VTTRAAPDLCDPDTAVAAARRAGLRLKRRLGQNLMCDRQALQAIVDALAPTTEDDVLEIGPGVGTLTVELAPLCRRLVALDLDAACVRATVFATHGLGDVSVLRRDALRTEPTEVGLRGRWLCAGNIPYGITGALLTHLLERPRPPQRAVITVQREVAARLAAAPGAWSLATVAVRSLADVERVRDIAPQSFVPPPAVHSSVLRLTPRAVLSPGDRAAVLALARPAFQMRRKVLRHGIGRALGGDEAAAQRVLGDAGIDPGRRPDTLDLEEWRALAEQVRALGAAVGAAR